MEELRDCHPLLPWLPLLDFAHQVAEIDVRWRSPEARPLFCGTLQEGVQAGGRRVREDLLAEERFASPSLASSQIIELVLTSEALFSLSVFLLEALCLEGALSRCGVDGDLHPEAGDDYTLTVERQVLLDGGCDVLLCSVGP
ncbi:hypothetical protein MRQ86_36240 [Streptomyces sp. MMS21 TC-5]|uniref:hypothetical protein n=1 Tax=Streptomyces sp. MMS21 TC-5 TaxID=2925833 RepID=UPI001F625FA5|nr:hypothetical protein [Streptomyces sp. MMS21 TC-5]MCI4085653.1 hypothetical protein [Streptomyces sp. MMS21 TC-5]